MGHVFFSAEIPTGPAHGVSVWGGHRWEDWMIDIVPLIDASNTVIY